MPKNLKIDLAKAIMQIEGNVNLNDTIYNYDYNGGVKFLGYSEINGEVKGLDIVMDKNQIEAINACDTVKEIYDCYKEMEYF